MSEPIKIKDSKTILYKDGKIIKELNYSHGERYGLWDLVPVEWDYKKEYNNCRIIKLIPKIWNIFSKTKNPFKYATPETLVKFGLHPKRHLDNGWVDPWFGFQFNLKKQKMFFHVNHKAKEFGGLSNLVHFRLRYWGFKPYDVDPAGDPWAKTFPKLIIEFNGFNPFKIRLKYGTEYGTALGISARTSSKPNRE